MTASTRKASTCATPAPSSRTHCTPASRSGPRSEPGFNTPQDCFWLGGTHPVCRRRTTKARMCAAKTLTRSQLLELGPQTSCSCLQGGRRRTVLVNYLQGTLAAFACTWISQLHRLDVWDVYIEVYTVYYIYIFCCLVFNHMNVVLLLVVWTWGLITSEFDALYCWIWNKICQRVQL